MQRQRQAVMYEDDAETSSYEDEEIIIARAHDKELRDERKPCSITAMYLMHAFVQETIIFIKVEEFEMATVQKISV